MLQNVGSVEPVVKGSNSRKRTATEALLEAMEKDGCSDVTPASPIDHNDYTLKPQKKRARTSTVTSESAFSEAESTVSSVSASTVDTAAVLPSTSGVEKHVERRVKNNIASRRSRETRKQKFASMETEAVRLEEENKKLRAKVEEMEKLAKHMKAELIKRLSKA